MFNFFKKIPATYLPDFSTLVADHGLVTELQAVVWDEHVVVVRSGTAVIQDSKRAQEDFGPLEVKQGDLKHVKPRKGL